jgi:hypothetical protein
VCVALCCVVLCCVVLCCVATVICELHDDDDADKDKDAAEHEQTSKEVGRKRTTWCVYCGDLIV